MRIIAGLLLALLMSSAFFGVCTGAVWFEGNNPQEPQQLQLSMQHNDNASTSLPICNLVLNETEPHLVNLTIIVSTLALFYQTGNFETWLSIDSQEPQKLVGLFDWEGSAAGEFYYRHYNLVLNRLEDGAHFLKIRVAGDYYGPDPEGGNYDCEGNATIIIGDQTVTSPTPITPVEPLLNPIIIAVALLLIIASIGLLIFKLRRRPKPKQDHS